MGFLLVEFFVVASRALSPGATTEATVSLQVPRALEGTVKFTGSIT